MCVRDGGGTGTLENKQQPCVLNPAAYSGDFGTSNSTVGWSRPGQPALLPLEDDKLNRFLLDLTLTDNPERPRWYCEAQHVSTLVNLVEAGLGVAAVPRLSMPPDGHPTLISVPLVEPVITRTVGLIRRRGRPLSPAAQQFYDLLFTLAPKAKKRKTAAR